MWRKAFSLLGTVAGIVAEATGLAGAARSGRRGRDGNSLLAELPSSPVAVSPAPVWRPPSKPAAPAESSRRPGIPGGRCAESAREHW